MLAQLHCRAHAGALAPPPQLLRAARRCSLAPGLLHVSALTSVKQRQAPRSCKRLQPCAAAATPPAVDDAPAAKAPLSPHHRRGGLSGLLHPFRDPAANGKLLALCTAQALGSVATLMHETYLPVYLSDTLHLSHTKIGGLQGVAQFLAKFSGSVSGALADVVSPASMVILGAALTAANKPMYAASGAVAAVAGTAACVYWVAFAKIFDRVAKGIREAPSKALIGELAAASGDSPAGAFGVRQSMATLGALVGASVAGLAVKATNRNYPLVFALSTAPALLALALLSAAFGGRRGALVPGLARPKPPHPSDAASSGAEGDGNGVGPGPAAALGVGGRARALAGALRPAYWQALTVVAILYMGRFDAAFATLRAKTVMPASSLPVLLPLVMVTQGFLAAPLGLKARASVGARNRVLQGGIAALLAADLCFAFLPSVQGMLLGAVLLGLHMGATHGVSLAMLASYIPATAVPGLGRISGTAWSLTDLLLGLVLVASNLLAGRLADATAQRGLGNIGCFLGGGAASVAAMAALAAFAAWGELGREELQAGVPAAAVAAKAA